MTKEQAIAILALTQDDPRIQAQAIKAGGGFRVRLTLRPGSPLQRTTTIRKSDDFKVIKVMWEENSR
jgi:hypothetical protein